MGDRSLRDDEEAVKQLQRQVADCTGCSLGVSDYLVAACLGTLRRQFGAETALDLAQHTLVEVLSSTDMPNTDPPPEGFALQE